MTALGALVGALTLAAVGTSCAPGRSATRRVTDLAHSARPTGPFPNDRCRPGPAAAAVVVERVGRCLRTWARRPPDPRADRAAGVAFVSSVSAAVVSPVLVVPVIGASLLVPVLARRRRRRQATSRMLQAAPDLTELFRTALAAGLTIHESIEPVAARAPQVTVDALRAIRGGLAVGHRLADLLDRLGHDHEPLRPLAVALASAERYGTELAPVLERVGADARHRRRRHAEEQARRIPVRMLLPLVLCILPAFGLLTIVPLLISAIGGLPR